jgi:hypothetical protein
MTNNNQMTQEPTMFKRVNVVQLFQRRPRVYRVSKLYSASFVLLTIALFLSLSVNLGSFASAYGAAWVLVTDVPSIWFEWDRYAWTSMRQLYGLSHLRAMDDQGVLNLVEPATTISAHSMEAIVRVPTLSMPSPCLGEDPQH